MGEFERMKREMVESLDIFLSCSLHCSASFVSSLLLSVEKELSSRKEKRKEEENEEEEKEEEEEEEEEEENIKGEEKAKIQLARSYLTFRQYQRIPHLLQTSSSFEGKFLSFYAKYKKGERRREEIVLQQPENSTEIPQNSELSSLRLDLEAVCSASFVGRGEREREREEGEEKRGGGEKREEKEKKEGKRKKKKKRGRKRWWIGLCFYLYGVVLRSLKELDGARMIFCEAIHYFPCNWSAWKELAELCTSIDILSSLSLPSHWMEQFFRPMALLVVHRYQEAIVKLEGLISRYGYCIPLETKIAEAYYNVGQHTEAEKRFEKIQKEDPTSLEGMDLYSHILFINENNVKLSHLAHVAMGEEGDRFALETYCIVGNYYALKGDHKKAILNFKRVLALDRRYLAAWTLIGHEFLELKMYGKAIECYRTASAMDPSDHKSWYMLGQIYEILKIPDFSLHYFRKATALQPYDGRMWQALGNIYQLMKPPRLEDAVKAYTRALETNCYDTYSLRRLGQLFKEAGNMEKCVYYWKWLAQCIQEDPSLSSEVPSDMYESLVEWCLVQYLKEKEREERKEREKAIEFWREGEMYCRKLMEHPESKQRGNALMACLREATGESDTEGKEKESFLCPTFPISQTFEALLLDDDESDHFPPK